MHQELGTPLRKKWLNLGDFKIFSHYNGFWGGQRYPPKEGEMQRLYNQL